MCTISLTTATETDETFDTLFVMKSVDGDVPRHYMRRTADRERFTSLRLTVEKQLRDSTTT